MPEQADTANAKADAPVRVLLIAPGPAGTESIAGVLREAGHDIVIAGGLTQAFEIAEKSHVDVVILEANNSTTLGILEAKRAKKDFAGRLIVSIPPKETGVRKEMLAELAPVVTLTDGDDEALLEQLGRVVAIHQHRQELEECEEGLRECTLRKPRRERIFHRYRRTILVASIIIIIATIVAIPIVLTSLNSAATTVQGSVKDATGVVDTMQRVEGYLQRDEERKINRSPK